MIKTKEQLKEQAEKIGLNFYPVHECGFCKFMCGYYLGENPEYNAGCDCVTYSEIKPRSWDDVAKTYNMNQPENNPKISDKFLKELNEVWKFDLSPNQT